MVRIVGEIDMATAPRLEELLALFEGPVEVDCTGLEFIDAAGLAVLARAAQMHDGLTIRSAPPILARLLELTDLADVVHLDGSTPG